MRCKCVKARISADVDSCTDASTGINLCTQHFIPSGSHGSLGINDLSSMVETRDELADGRNSDGSAKTEWILYFSLGGVVVVAVVVAFLLFLVYKCNFLNGGKFD